MKIGIVVGTVVSTVKYDRYKGLKLLRVRNLTLEGDMVGDDLLALDAADAGVGDIVLLNNDGVSSKMVIGDPELVAGLTICGVVDHYTWNGKTVYCH